MIVKSKIKGHNEWLFIEEIPDIYTPGNPISEKKVAIQKSPIHMANYQLSTGGMFLLHSNMYFDEARLIQTEVSGETITCQFIFYGTQGENKMKKMPGKSRHNIRYIPSTNQNYKVAAGLELTYFLVVLSKDYYFQLIDRHSMLHESFVKDIEKGRYTSFSTEDFAVTAEMKRVINDLTECSKTGDLKKLHTESRVMELLMFQMEQMQEKHHSEKMLLRGSDIEKIELARSILNQSFSNPPTLKELSREILLNEFKLKKAFKEYLGRTVYDYITRIRMEKARKLLLTEDFTVAEIALKVGFKHTPAFSSAFRKYFGLPPSEIKTRIEG